MQPQLVHKLIEAIFGNCFASHSQVTPMAGNELRH